MLLKLNRIKKKKDFERIFKTGRSFKRGFLVFKVASGETNQARFGIVVSSKVSKSAVVRNKVRRRISEILRHNAVEGIGGCDVVLVALNGIENQDFKQLKETILGALEKMGLFH